jgi:hypothetical protein
MTAISSTHAAAFALALTLGADVALAQAAHEQHHPQTQPQAPMSGATTPSPGMIGPGMMQQMPPGMMGHGMGPGMMGQRMMWHVGPHPMSPEEMQEMMAQMGGMMGQGMGPGMMGQQPGHGMMQQMPPGMMGHGMMGQTEPGMMGHHAMMGQGAGPGMMGQLGTGMGGWSGLEGRRVVPMMQLSVDDVRIFLERYLESLGNARLKVGKVTEADNDTITAEIVTVDDSLVASFAVDRHTGVISAAG